MPEKKPTILIVDDDLQLLQLVALNLELEGYAVLLAGDGQQALTQIETHAPDLVLLDVMMPRMNGFAVCHRVREFSTVPIIIITAQGRNQDKVRGLDLGADDYLTKPFGTDELLARLRAALRHAARETHPPEPVVYAGNVIVDLARHVVKRGEEEVRLTSTEYKLLTYLATNAGRVLTHRQILEHVWGPGYKDETQNLRVYVSQLRRKLDPDSVQPQMITTEPGVGYRFIADEV